MSDCVMKGGVSLRQIKKCPTCGGELKVFRVFYKCFACGWLTELTDIEAAPV
jgi:hypothetical protein